MCAAPDFMLDSIPQCGNHFQMLGIASSDRQDVMEAIGLALKTTSAQRYSLPRDMMYCPVEGLREVHYYACDAFGSGIQLVVICEGENILTSTPSFRGSSFHEFSVEDIYPGGAYEATLAGHIRNNLDELGYKVQVTVPNLFTNDFWAAPRYSKMNIHMSGLFSAAYACDPPPLMTQARRPDGSVYDVDMSRTGLLWPLGSVAGTRFPMYLVAGNILDFQRVTNKVTKANIGLFFIDTKITELEVVGNLRFFKGTPKLGAHFKAYVWLQGQILARVGGK